MKQVLVTGANGFIGKNLIAHLNQRVDVQVLSFDVENTPEELAEYVHKADFIYHLAGINRPTDVSEFDKGNRGLTIELLELMKKTQTRASLLLSSSIQAEMDNPYGLSKLAAEETVFSYEADTGIPVFVFRLPNAFGKWCRPNYNSVVATFCHNASHDLPLQVHQPDAVLTLVYIDDVVNSFLQAMDGAFIHSKGSVCTIPVTYKITLQELADKMAGFRKGRSTLQIMDFSTALDRVLYATYLSYLEPSDFSYPLTMIHDNRGWLAEFIKSPKMGQVFISKTKPGITRGNHWHHTKVEKFLVVQGKALITFRRIGSDEVVSYPVCGDELKVLDIPVGYTHAIKNTGDSDLITVFWSDEIFDSAHPDFIPLEV